MGTEALDRQRADAFAERMLGLLNDAALALMVSVGHRTGLFDAMADGRPVTADALARGAGLHERYVREWLAAMVTGRIVEYDPADRAYRLPPEHAASLTRAAEPANLATTAQWIPVLGSVEDRIVECFRRGGGVPYEAYPRFHEVMAEESNQTVLHALVDTILPVVPGLVERLRGGIDMLDVGCGSGRAINLLARTFPASRFTGCDLSAEGIAAARAEADRLGVRNARFEAVDAARLDVTAAYDLVTTFDAVHDQADPRAVLRNIHRALRAGGTYLMQDIGAASEVHENLDHPMGPFLYAISCLHCMTVSLAAGGAGLGAMWGDRQIRSLLREAGFTGVVMYRLPHDVMNYYYVATKG
jgi:SAM-dependent methyltransferase